MPAGSSYIMKEHMLSHRINEAGKPWDGVGTEEAGSPGHTYRFQMSNQLLHAVHPLGFFQKIAVKLDGEELDPGNMYFVLRGQWFYLPAMGTITETFWRLTEEAQIVFTLDRELSEGAHTVECIFTMSMLEDTRILDKNDRWPKRVESVRGEMLYQRGATK